MADSSARVTSTPTDSFVTYKVLELVNLPEHDNDSQGVEHHISVYEKADEQLVIEERDDIHTQVACKAEAGDGEDEDEGITEPPMKKVMLESMNMEEVPRLVYPKPNFDVIDTNMPLKQMLININSAVCGRLEAVESTLSRFDETIASLQSKLDHVHRLVQSRICDKSSKDSATVVTISDESGMPSKGRGTLITLNSEADYPNGSWLGDENDPERRVRIPIAPSNLLHLNTNCRTSEKMALSLLDYLFDRDTQACSNLSGAGKHGKRQLNPLFIYGIRCHLAHRFTITENDWHRIKQNVDSKCRTAFRRKHKGLPMQVKAFRSKGEQGGGAQLQLVQDALAVAQDPAGLTEADLTIASPVLAAGGAALPLGALTGGEIHIVHATPEQLSQLQATHQLQLLTAGPQILQPLAGLSVVSLAQRSAAPSPADLAAATAVRVIKSGELRVDSSSEGEMTVAEAQDGTITSIARDGSVATVVTAGRGPPQ